MVKHLRMEMEIYVYGRRDGDDYVGMKDDGDGRETPPVKCRASDNYNLRRYDGIKEASRTAYARTLE